MAQRPNKSVSRQLPNSRIIGWLPAMILPFVLGFAIYGVSSFIQITKGGEDRYLLCFKHLNDADNSLSLIYQWQETYLDSKSARQQALAKRQIQAAIEILNSAMRDLDTVMVNVEDDLGLVDLKQDIKALLSKHRSIIRISQTQPQQASSLSELQYRSLNDMVRSRITKIQERNLLQAALSNRRQYRQLVTSLVAGMVILFLLAAVLAVNASIQRRSKDALFESEGRFRAVLNSLDAFVYVADMKTHELLFVNEHAQKVWNANQGQKCYECILGHRSKPCEFCPDKKLIDEKGTPQGVHIWEFFDPNEGKWYECRNQAIRWTNRQIVHMGIGTDITWRKQVEDALRSNEENLRITLDSIGDAVIATDSYGRIMRMNPAAEELTGWPAEQAIGQEIAKVFEVTSESQADTGKNMLNKVIEDGRTIHIEQDSILIAKDGTQKRISDSCAPIRNASGELVGMVLVFRDVTLQIKLEEQLRQSQKMESIGKLAGGVAHDFNNMLTGIMGTAELARMDIGESNPELVKQIDLIISTAEQAASLTSKLLDFARKGKMVSAPYNIHDCINDVITILQRSIDRRITIETRLTAQLSTVLADPSQIQNAVLNLAINARDAMPQGGTLLLKTENTHLDPSFCHASPFDLTPGPYILITVSDTGIGMSPETLKQIFEPFFTTKELGKGTGLGLPAVYGTIKAHHGAITVYSELNVGTVFRIYLPVCLSEQAPAPAVPIEEIEQGTGTVLVVDDEEVVRLTATHILEGLGYDVIVAEDGLQGLELYRQQSDSIDLILLDMVMPRMSGQEAAREIRKINPNARILMTSGYTRDRVISQTKEEGIHGFVKKPYRKAELGKAIARAMRG